MKEAFEAFAKGFVRDFLGSLARSGAKATARAVDSILEDADDHLDALAARIRQGRQTAQGIGQRPPRKVNVDVRTVDAEVVDAKEES